MNKMEKRIVDNKAITLIALIITIVVLLILAGVAINGISGSDNVVERAKESKDINNLKLKTEEIQAIITQTEADEIKRGNFSGNASLEQVKSSITQKYSSAQFLNNTFPLKVVIEDNTYYINQQGEVNYIGYLEKEYLKSTGTQYIDTEVNAANTLDLEITFKTDVDAMTVDNKGSYAAFFGAQNKDINRTFTINFGGNKGQHDIFTWKNNTYSNGAEIKCFSSLSHNPINKIKITCINNIWRVNNAKTATSESVGDWKDEDQSLIVFGISRFENSTKTISPFYENMYLYSLKLWDNGTLIRDYIPVISYESGHENEPGLFDKVEGKFYYNKGTGSFQTN